MLRSLFHEPRRVDEGHFQKANAAIDRYVDLLRSISSEQRNLQERRYIIWSGSFIRALDELEQSQYAANRYGKLVSHTYVDELNEQERDDYHRHLYFYKNAIIRLFAILDKLGHFMNDRFRLKTEEIKSRFSYFTVLRNMHQHRLYVELEEQLFGLKGRYKEPVERLRNERNMEIHTINADLLDDLLRTAEERQSHEDRMRIDDIAQRLKDLDQACDMTYQAAGFIFLYITKLTESSGRYGHE
ncbi:Cthe_2314 family HEPN domain-containing protein [Paenibacillus rigui]|uniref:Cthe-2314-like HEPN domain-containing protein n=1 Tax=Paenibacillus rigui TaxID=554312 RepID=A0A229UUB2_9BACL|nr:Cthe_2314 family HEPN domain-containing protein [Paenibacillus rigui]OXM87187.1 hypothetical protein CF651_05930 [Paenibacillus rigui]